MKKISLDNGLTYLLPSEIDWIGDVNDEDSVQLRWNDYQIPWEVVVNQMDDETREKIHNDLAPCSVPEFLEAYLREAPEDIIIP